MTPLPAPPGGGCAPGRRGRSLAASDFSHEEETQKKKRKGKPVLAPLLLPSVRLSVRPGGVSPGGCPSALPLGRAVLTALG